MHLSVSTALFAALVGCLLDEAQSSQPDFCHGLKCPNFKVISRNEAFEVRDYAQSRWITTPVDGYSLFALKGGYDKLMQVEGIPDTWPVLLTVVEESDKKSQLYVSLYIDDSTVNIADSSVKVEIIPACTIYVRVFHGTVTHATGEAQVKELRKDLDQASKDYEAGIYRGAAYDSAYDLFHQHHNEVWIKAKKDSM